MIFSIGIHLYRYEKNKSSFFFQIKEKKVNIVLPAYAEDDFNQIVPDKKCSFFCVINFHINII